MAQMGCRCDQDMRDQFGCEKPTQHAVWRDIEENEYYGCPINFIPENVSNWWSEYKYYKDIGGGPPYHTLPSKWLDAASVYNSYLNKYNDEMQQKNKPDTLAPLRQTIGSRRG